MTQQPIWEFSIKEESTPTGSYTREFLDTRSTALRAARSSAEHKLQSMDLAYLPFNFSIEEYASSKDGIQTFQFYIIRHKYNE